MVILDIDQDFFYSYDGPGSEHGTAPPNEFRNYSSLENVMNTFDAKTKSFKIFSEHDEAFYEIKKSGMKDITLIHLDRHDDLDRPEYGNPNVHIGNWVTHAIRQNYINKVIWVRDSKDLFSGYIKENDKEIPYEATNMESITQIPIDIVFFTISPGFCPHNMILLEFISTMRPVLEQHNGEVYI